MRGLGDFQRAQMRDADLRIPELFGHLRHAIELLEQIALRPHRPAAEPKRAMETEANTVKEVCKLVGISAATLY